MVGAMSKMVGTDKVLQFTFAACVLSTGLEPGWAAKVDTFPFHLCR